MAGAPIGNTPLFVKVEQIVSVRPSIRDTIFAKLDLHELKAVPAAAPISGALELLSHISKVAELGLVTMQGSAACDKILGRHHLGELFDVQVTREDSLDRAEQLRIALQSLSSSPKDTLFTGDGLDDVRCGRRVGVDTALVGREQTGEARPDYTFTTLAIFKDGII
ncbi:MAG: HAD hydrolase-like protein [Nitrososphaerales archaeon]